MRIAFLFLVRDNLSQPKIWQEFFSQHHNTQQKPIILAHAKHPSRVTDPIIKNALIKKYIETEWGHSSITLVMITLAFYALQQGADRLIYLSETCVPLQPYDHICNFLKSSKNSWFMPLEIPPSQLKIRYNGLTSPKYIKPEQLKKTSQWCILNRSDAQIVVRTAKHHFPNYIRFKVPDEHYIFTVLYNHYKGKYRFNTGLTTLVDWSRPSNNYKHPHTFVQITAEDLKILRDTNSLFGRRFEASSDIAKYIPELWQKDVTVQNIRKTSL